jgi:hypothetical protein
MLNPLRIRTHNPLCGTSGTRCSYGMRGSCRLLGSSPMVCCWWTHIVDSTGGLLSSRDPHVPPCMCRDHGDVLGCHHDPRSSYRWHYGLWAGVSRLVEGHGRGCYRHSTPDVPSDQKDKKLLCVHSGWLTASFDTCPEGAEDEVVHTYARSCLWHMDDELHFSILIQFLCN